jgi:hypothetical protein
MHPLPEVTITNTDRQRLIAIVTAAPPSARRLERFDATRGKFAGGCRSAHIFPPVVVDTHGVTNGNRAYRLSSAEDTC